MKKIAFLILLAISAFGSDMVSKHNHFRKQDIEVYCLNGQAYYVNDYLGRDGIMTPAIIEGQFVRCQVIKKDYRSFSFDNNVIKFYIIKKDNSKKIINF